MYKIKTSFPATSEDLYPAKTPNPVKYDRNYLIFQASGGTY